MYASLPLALLLMSMMGATASAQVNVLTAHNDIARTGQNLQETVLTPSTVSNSTFGLLFSQPVNGEIFGQPLYVSQLAIPNKGTHNVVYVVTATGNPNSTIPGLTPTGKYAGDSVYAFDANLNGGIVDQSPLWQVSLLPSSNSNYTYAAYTGILGTPVIDLASNTMYLVSSEIQMPTSGAAATQIARLHALDITTGAEKFQGPMLIQASVPGTGVGSVSGSLTFDPEYQVQRPGLLLLNGVVYVAFGSHNDNGPWHGWIISYNAATLAQIDVFCTTPSGGQGGIWMGGSGLAAEVYNPAKPYGRMFIATANGGYAPKAGNVSMSVLDFDLTGGQMTVEDSFTPYNWSMLNGQDGDLGSGGPILLPTQKLASGKSLNPLIEVGKTGLLYILDRDNNADGSNNAATEYAPAGLGGFNATADQVVQEVQTPESGPDNWGAGVWGSEAYWNGNIYYGGAGSDVSGDTDNLTAYSFANGVLSTTPTSHSTIPASGYTYPGPTPSVSANGATNGIVWALDNPVGGLSTLTAYDATNLANMLYTSNDGPAGLSVEMTVPTIANGNVYVGIINQLRVYGLLASAQTAGTPRITAPATSFTNSEMVTITDTTPGAAIYYTTNGTAPTTSSVLYTAPFSINTTETISAIASATNYLQSKRAAVTYTSLSDAANPVFSLAAGSYSGAQTLTITDSTPGAVIYYTFDGTVPTASSYVYSQPLSIPVSETIQALAVAPPNSGLQASSAVSAVYTVTPPYAISFPTGFATAQSSGQMQFNGSTGLDDFRLQLTDGGSSEAGSAIYMTPVNIQSFTTDFTFQLSNPVGDGMTFVIEGVGPTALGANASGLGYAGIANSVAIKFDFYNDANQGNDSTGLYINGVSPTLPSIDLTNTGINLRSGDYMNVQVTYDGRLLSLTITDAITLATWSHAFTVNIPYHVGGNTAYVGFTASTGGSSSSSQKITYWTFLSGQPPVPNFPAGFDYTGLSFLGCIGLNGTAYNLTNGLTNEASAVYASTPLNAGSFNTSFDFEIAPGSSASLGNGFTFVVQNAGLLEIGGRGSSLGYAAIPSSVAIKFDVNTPVGQGTNSTGVYVNGALPTTPAIDLTPSGVVLGSGDTIHANVVYNGTTLTWTLTDTTLPSHPSATNSVAINIPDTVGGNVAYFGFTAGAGTATSVQSLLDWTFTYQ